MVTRVVFEVKEETIPSPEALALPNNNTGHNLHAKLHFEKSDGRNYARQKNIPSSSIRACPS